MENIATGIIERQTKTEGQPFTRLSHALRYFFRRQQIQTPKRIVLPEVTPDRTSRSFFPTRRYCHFPTLPLIFSCPCRTSRIYNEHLLLIFEPGCVAQAVTPPRHRCTKGIVVPKAALRQRYRCTQLALIIGSRCRLVKNLFFICGMIRNTFPV